MARSLHEVRVREKVGPEKWTKKSKFYEAESPGEARKRYKGPGHIMWVEKVSREKLLGIGEFFKLGDSLLKELNQNPNIPLQEKEREKTRNRKRRIFNEKRKEANY